MNARPAWTTRAAVCRATLCIVVGCGPSAVGAESEASRVVRRLPPVDVVSPSIQAVDSVAGVAASEVIPVTYQAPSPVFPSGRSLGFGRLLAAAEREGVWGPIRQPGAEASYPTLSWSGFLQADTGFVSQTEANRAAVGDIDSSTGLRRTRLRAEGHVRSNASYMIDLDFSASGHPSFRDVLFSISEAPLLQNVAFGYGKTPFGLDTLMSSREFVFMERQLPFALAPFRQIGIFTHGVCADESVVWAVAGFRYPTDSFGVFQGGTGGNGIAARAVAILWRDETPGRLLQLGFDYALGDPGDDVVRYAIQPSFFVRDPGTGEGGNGSSVPVIVDTGDIPTNLFHLLNLELALQHGPFHVAAEARVSQVDQRGGPVVTFPGCYFESAYVLTGESRGYERKLARFRGVKPANEFQWGDGWGALELALGWSCLNLNSENIHGGRASDLICGVNWYPNEYAKFQLNVIPYRLNDPDAGVSRSVVTAMRAQVEF